jgi:hypothetical protein
MPHVPDGLPLHSPHQANRTINTEVAAIYRSAQRHDRTFLLGFVYLG